MGLRERMQRVYEDFLTPRDRTFAELVAAEAVPTKALLRDRKGWEHVPLSPPLGRYIYWPFHIEGGCGYVKFRAAGDGHDWLIERDGVVYAVYEEEP